MTVRPQQLERLQRLTRQAGRSTRLTYGLGAVSAGLILALLLAVETFFPAAVAVRGGRFTLLFLTWLALAPLIRQVYLGQGEVRIKLSGKERKNAAWTTLTVAAIGVGFFVWLASGGALPSIDGTFSPFLRVAALLPVGALVWWSMRATGEAVVALFVAGGLNTVLNGAFARPDAFVFLSPFGLTLLAIVGLLWVGTAQHLLFLRTRRDLTQWHTKHHDRIP